MIFPGFLIKGELFCQDLAEDKFIQFGYLSKEKTKLFLSPNGQSSDIEFERPDNLGKSLRSILKIIPDQNMNFLAGSGTANPFWLQVSVPLQSSTASQASIFYDFL